MLALSYQCAEPLRAVTQDGAAAQWGLCSEEEERILSVQTMSYLSFLLESAALQQSCCPLHLLKDSN